MNQRFAWTLAFAVLSGCRPDPAALRDALLDADREFARASQVHRLDAWVDMFADSGLLVRSNAPLTKGVVAVRESMGSAFADSSFSLNWEPVLAEASRAGDLGYTVGLSQQRRRGLNGEPVMTSGKYVTIWRKDAAGRWGVALQASLLD